MFCPLPNLISEYALSQRKLVLNRDSTHSLLRILGFTYLYPKFAALMAAFALIRTRVFAGNDLVAGPSLPSEVEAIVFEGGAAAGDFTSSRSQPAPSASRT